MIQNMVFKVLFQYYSFIFVESSSWNDIEIFLDGSHRNNLQCSYIFAKNFLFHKSEGGLLCPPPFSFIICRVNVHPSKSIYPVYVSRSENT